jgi:opacity protein-like surface antigen
MARAFMWTSIVRPSVPAAVLVLSCVGIASPVRAQMTVSPSIGISGEGQPTVGAAIGMSLGVVRPELELGWSRRGIDRGAATPSEERRRNLGVVASAPPYLPAVMADVSTLMIRVAVPLRHGRTFDPFGSVGVGLARATRPPPPGESLQRTDTQFGIEAGGGATAWLTGRIGLRTAATYYKVLGPPSNFHGAPGSGLVYTNVLRDFSLTRLTVGIDIRLSGAKRADHNEPSRIDPGAARSGFPDSSRRCFRISKAPAPVCGRV